MNSPVSDHLTILDAAETVARVYGDTVTAQQLIQLSAEVRDAEDTRGIEDSEKWLPPRGPEDQDR